MMPGNKKLFLSVVSSEFLACRTLLAGDLKRPNLDVAVQEGFGVLGRTTLEKLDTYIRHCDGVIHLIGKATGAVPEEPAVAALLAQYPDFSQHLPQLAEFLRQPQPGFSYTQWEAYIAIYHRRPLFVYLPTDFELDLLQVPRDDRFVFSAAEAQSQKDHYGRIAALGHDRGQFLNEERLSSAVLRDLVEILPRLDSDTQADISRILKYAPAELIGREHELNLLTAAWKGDFQGLATYPVATIKHRPKVLTFVALGGEGKTSLIAKWTTELAAQDWPGCDAVFAWSFYSQGTKDQVAASSDLFLKEALTFFGDAADKDFAASAAGAFERGQRLARIVGHRRCLLILDGLEPLQYAPTSPTPGQLKDQGIAALLKGLAQNSHGLCVVTTRFSLPDVKAFWQTSAPEVKLLRLSREAGVHLLKYLGVKGSELRNQPLKDGDDTNERLNEFEKLVEDVKGHALTLTLLGGFLKRAFHGDIRQRDRVKFEKADERMDGGHAFRTMAAYEQWLLRDGGDEGRREVAVLRLMGLFDRPADAGCVAALRRAPIQELTETLTGLIDEDWEFCISGLESAKLLTVNRSVSGTLVSLDAHAHLREYHAKQLREKYPRAWREGHQRLYKHLMESNLDKERPTLEDLKPLYQAVAHGCHAGLYQSTYDDIFVKRIFRGGPIIGYSWRTLGAAGADVEALSFFFERPLETVVANLEIRAKGEVLGIVGVLLGLLGRLDDGIRLLENARQHHLRHKCWLEAAIATTCLSSDQIILGDLKSARRHAVLSRHLVAKSNGCEKWDWKIRCLAFLASIYDKCGQTNRAEEYFAKVETELEKNAGLMKNPRLHFAGGFCHAGFFLEQAQRVLWLRTLSSNGTDISSQTEAFLSRAEKVAKKMSAWAKSAKSKAHLAVSDLNLSRIEFFRLVFRGESDAIQEYPTNLEKDIDAVLLGLRGNEYRLYLPDAFLLRAWLRFLTDKRTGSGSSQEDLDEAGEIAERGSMRLHMADIHLYRARLFFRESQYPWNTHPDGSPRGPEDDLLAAEKLINECGYHRRDEELADAKRVILGA